MTITDRVVEYLKTHGRGTVKGVAAELGLKPYQIRNCLLDNPHKFDIMYHYDGVGNIHRWKTSRRITQFKLRERKDAASVWKELGGRLGGSR